jgi:hypothetical protein
VGEGVKRGRRSDGGGGGSRQRGESVEEKRGRLRIWEREQDGRRGKEGEEK